MLKIQCRCGHKIAVPTDYGGKRVKCPKCHGAIQVPMTAGAAAGAPARAAAPARAGRGAPSTYDPPPSQEPSHDAARNARAIRHARERARKSHNTTVAIVAGVMVLLGLGLMLIIGAMNRPEAPPQTEPEPKKRGGGGVLASTGGANDSRATDAGRSSDDRSDENVRIAGQDFTAGDGEATPIATTATFDAASGVTTLKARPSQVSIDGRIMTLNVTAMHEGKDLRAATQTAATIRLKGDFTGLVAGANTDDPVLLVEVDSREFEFKPSKREGGDAREGQNAPEKLPNVIEYVLDRTVLTAMSRGTTIKTTLGPSEFGFTPEQLAMFKGFVPAPAKPVRPKPAEGEKEMEEKDAGPKEPPPATPKEPAEPMEEEAK